MLHESVKLKKYLCMGSQKFMNGYLGIHRWVKVSKPLTDGG